MINEIFNIFRNPQLNNNVSVKDKKNSNNDLNANNKINSINNIEGMESKQDYKKEENIILEKEENLSKYFLYFILIFKKKTLHVQYLRKI